jgi:ABC-type polysaccharide/polyol phosphate transport system ATPase subunit
VDVIRCNDLGIRFLRGRPRSVGWFVLKAVLGLKPTAPTAGEGRADKASLLWAVRHVDLAIPMGSSLGICGPNGAGKTTLMRLIAGIYRPDEGTVTVSGKTSALLSLGVGISSSLTGREYLRVVGAMHGLSRKEVRDRYEEIRDFSGLDEATMNTAVRAYSSGMRTRLGFAIYAVLTPEVLLIDEVLAVGDASFRQKSIDRLAELRKHARAVVVSSHNLGFLKEACDTALWLDGGHVRAYGPSAEVVDAYEAASRPG